MHSVLLFLGNLLSKIQNVVLGVLPIRKKKEQNVINLPPGISRLEITKNILLLHNEEKAKTDSNLNKEQEKSLVVLLGWMSSRREHTQKYADIWIKRGFDVLTINFTVPQWLLPVRGTHVVAAEVLKFLDQESKSYSQIIIHGFSAGGYLWGEILVQWVRDMDQYKHIEDRIIGQVWDSLGDMEEVPLGISTAIFPKNKFLANVALRLILFHLTVSEYIATRHYRAAGAMFHENVVRAPALLIWSKTDPIGSEKTHKRVIRNWEKLGIKVEFKVFEDSPHVGHYKQHPEEYVAELDTFLSSLPVNAK